MFRYPISYSSTRDRLFWFDNLVIDATFVPDTLPPDFERAGFISSSVVVVEFDEPILPGCIDPSNFSIAGIANQCLNITNRGSNVYELHFAEVFENKREYTLVTGFLCDINGNCRGEVHKKIELNYPEWGDIIISEFLADPDPAVHLPGCEYVEIFNRSEYPFSVSRLQFQ
ncbi:MAG: hypothetical protein R2744_11075 [Bacteroidales bacterium]